MAAMREYLWRVDRLRDTDWWCYLWVEVDDRVDLDGAKFEAAQRGVRFRADDAFVYAGGGARHFRIPFASVTDDGLVEGIKIVESVLADSVTDQPVVAS